MFYAHFVLAKKGPMARIWLAAHWDKKLTKAHVCETNIETSVDGILEPKVKMALRTTGHLLLGIVRIYSRKAKYLLADCNEAFMKIKMAFRPGMVDLPEENREAAVNTITLPEVFHNFENFRIDFEDLELQEQLANTLVMRPEEITLREVYGRLDVDFDNGFGEVQPDLDDSASGSGNDVGMSELRDSVASEQLREASLQVSMNENFASKRTTRSMQSRFLQTRFLDESAKPAATAGGGTQFLTDDSGSNARGIFDDLSELHRDDGGLSRPGSNRLDGTLQFDEGGFDDFGGDDLARPATPSEAGLPEPDLEVTFRQPQLLLRPSGSRSLASVGVGSMSEHTTLLHDEAESFALEPVDASAIRGQARPKRKRRLIVDNVKSMSAEDMKSQMLDSEDILIPLDLAPPTKKLMVMQEVGATDRLFAFPVRGVFSRELLRQFHVQALLPPEEAEEIFGLLGDSERDWLGLDRTPAPHRSHENTPKKQGKKRKAPAEDEPPASTTTINKRADKENMPPPTCATPSRAHPPTPGPSSVLNSPSIVRSGNRLVTPSFSGNTPSKLAASKYPPTPGNAGTHSIDEPHFESNDFGDFDDYDLGGEWNPPALDEPASSPARRSVVTPASHSASQSRRGLSSAMSDVSEQRVDGEASEAFEERTRQQKIDEVTVWLKSRLVSGSDSVAFSKLTEQVRRKEAAQRFYSLLVLKKQNVVDVSQDTDSDEIKIVRGPCFETAAVC